MTLGIALYYTDKLKREEHIRKCSRKCFAKVSGDVFLEEPFLNWAVEVAKENRLVIAIGGGSQINHALEKHGVGSERHPRLGRQTTPEGYRTAHAVLRRNRAALMYELGRREAIVDVILPVLDLAGEICHVDGDLMVYNAYWGFDALFVITTSDRVAGKRELFRDMPKVSVISF